MSVAALPYATDDGWPARATLGLVVLQVDETIEQEFPILTGSGAGPGPVRLYHTRIPSGSDLTAGTITRMAHDLPQAVRLLPPAVEFDIIGYACTSGAAVLGEEHVAELIATVRPGVPVTTPLTALKAACRVLGIKRLALVSPYVAEVSDALRRRLEDAEIEVTGFGSFNRKEERVVARITPASVLEALAAIGSGSHCDAIFASCTNLRVAGIIPEAEARLGKPVLCSNQVLAWHMLRLAGIGDSRPEGGVLFDHGSP